MKMDAAKLSASETELKAQRASFAEKHETFRAISETLQDVYGWEDEAVKEEVNRVQQELLPARRRSPEDARRRQMVVTDFLKEKSTPASLSAIHAMLQQSGFKGSYMAHSKALVRLSQDPAVPIRRTGRYGRYEYTGEGGEGG